MIASVQISETIPLLVRAIDSDNYEDAIWIFRGVKSLIRLLKAQYGRGMDYSKLDEVMENLEFALESGMEWAKELQQEFLYLLTDLGIPIK